jgi:hypothetical protein
MGGRTKTMVEETATEAAQLQITGVFGNDSACVLLARRSAERQYDCVIAEGGDPAPATLVLQLDEEGLVVLTRIPHMTNNCWQSAYGKAYIATENGQVVVYDGERFSAERVADEDTDITKVFGCSLEDGSDVVLALTGIRCFLRGPNGWHELALPEDTSYLCSAVVRSASEVYLVAEVDIPVILLYDGSEFTILEIPDTEFSGLALRDNGDMLATSDEGLYYWLQSEHRWDLYKTDTPLNVGLIDRGDEVLLTTREGVLSWDGTSFHRVVSGFYTNWLYVIGTATFACNTGGGLWSDLRGTWQQIPVPESLLEWAE